MSTTNHANVYFSQLPAWFSEQDLISVLPKDLKIKSSRVKLSSPGVCAGYGFVMFENNDMAAAAIARLNGVRVPASRPTEQNLADTIQPPMITTGGPTSRAAALATIQQEENEGKRYRAIEVRLADSKATSKVVVPTVVQGPPQTSILQVPPQPQGQFNQKVIVQQAPPPGSQGIAMAPAGYNTQHPGMAMAPQQQQPQQMMMPVHNGAPIAYAPQGYPMMQPQAHTVDPYGQQQPHPQQQQPQQNMIPVLIPAGQPAYTTSPQGSLNNSAHSQQVVYYTTPNGSVTSMNHTNNHQHQQHPQPVPMQAMAGGSNHSAQGLAYAPAGGSMNSNVSSVHSTNTNQHAGHVSQLDTQVNLAWAN